MTRANPDRLSPSRRTLLAAISVVPAIAIPLPPMPESSSHWRAAVENWQRAEAALTRAARRFNEAERRWFGSRDDATSVALEHATHDHNRHLDRWIDARRAMLDTRAPDLAAVIWKIEVITDWFGLDIPEELDFLSPDLRALQTAQFGRPDGDTS